MLRLQIFAHQETIMFSKDNAASEVQSAANEAKSSITLDAESQSPEFSGHESAEYGEGGPKAAGPKGVGE